MYTIFDYVEYYRHLDTADAPWNVMDCLLCSVLAYVPAASFEGEKDIDEFISYSEAYSENMENGLVTQVYELLTLIKGSIRYGNMRVSNFINLRSDKTQFGAVTFRVGKNVTVSYKGTDYALIGWIENMRGAYQYPTATHSLAISYLDNVSLYPDDVLYVCGHSKGGNLAMAACMEAAGEKLAVMDDELGRLEAAGEKLAVVDDSLESPGKMTRNDSVKASGAETENGSVKFSGAATRAADCLFDRIKKIYNFDGPGFRKDEYDQVKFALMAEKLTTIVPTDSVVGVLMNNNTDYVVVKSNSIALGEHYPTTWEVFGQCFVEGRLSNISRRLHTNTTKGVENISYDTMKLAFETIFENLNHEYATDFKLSFGQIVTLYRSLKNIDPEIKRGMDQIIEAVLSLEFMK